MTFTTEILTVITPILVSILAWFYKRDADQNQSTIKSLNTGMEELKAMVRIHTTNYEHLLREVQKLAEEASDNRKDITDIERKFSSQITDIRLDMAHFKKSG